ncbi:hypothetical protein TPAR_07487 [Tolypocladium paradoxum]|uniref:Uncharacterized protein n=1 Tax=Tolypocladium paradoxum TaxID=94208 RepID=A0A2S4KQ49_9HYPO|nr:hypothetical protein TPAR_07487 [Tolypocladium paradoxum]
MAATLVTAGGVAGEEPAPSLVTQRALPRRTSVLAWKHRLYESIWSLDTMLVNGSAQPLPSGLTHLKDKVFINAPRMAVARHGRIFFRATGSFYFLVVSLPASQKAVAISERAEVDGQSRWRLQHGWLPFYLTPYAYFEFTS